VGPCTGCVIQAYNPITTSFVEDYFDRWAPTPVTATIATETTVYDDTTVITTRTINQTATIVNSKGQTITHTTPVFTVTPAWGTTLTLEAGPTYVIYNQLWGGLDRLASKTYLDPPMTVSTCGGPPDLLENWEPVRTEDWNHLVVPYTSLPAEVGFGVPVPLPSNVLEYLQKNLAIQSQFHGSNIATCTLRPSKAPSYPSRTGAPTEALPMPTEGPVTGVPPMASFSTNTYISMTYETTSIFTSVPGCLRIGCGGSKPSPGPVSNGPGYSENVLDDQPTSVQSRVLQPSKNVVEVDTPTDSPNRPGNDPPNDQRPPGNPITIGDGTYTVRPGQPTSNPDRPNEPNRPIVVGTATLNPGQSTVINGVPVIVPSDGGGTRIVVGGTTLPVNNGPTAAPVLTVGRSTVTADAQGQFIVGTGTLKPGGPALTVDGSTLSLGPGGTIAVINGVTQTLANAPMITPFPVLTVGGRIVSATLIGGTTQLIVGGQTLNPGNVLTISGTTYSLPSSGSGTVIIVNGVSSTLNLNQFLGQQSIAASIRDGTTAFIFGPGQTLTPGGVLTVSGTTFSMPSGPGSVVVINGVTSTLSQGSITAAPALTINGRTYTANVRDGTTEFVIAPGMTLRPGEVLTISGTTYSLDKAGTALVINGQTSSIATGPARNSASTTASASSTKARDVGDFIWSGIGGGGGGGSSSSRAGVQGRSGGLDKWIESVVVGVAGWMVMLL
jgi:hypothetical protein